MNKTFFMLALLVTFGYIVYYAVTIARDIVKSKKSKGGEIETFDTGEEDDGGESTPRYIGENGETEKPEDREDKDPNVDNQPHADASEQIGNDQQSGGDGQHINEDIVEEPIPVLDIQDYRKVLGYAKEIALETPVKPEYEQLMESDDYLEEMMSGIDNSSQIKIIYNRL